MFKQILSAAPRAPLHQKGEWHIDVGIIRSTVKPNGNWIPSRKRKGNTLVWFKINCITQR